MKEKSFWTFKEEWTWGISFNKNYQGSLGVWALVRVHVHACVDSNEQQILC